MTDARPTIAILGASGLIGSALAEDLRRAGFPVVGLARRAGPGQTARVGLDTVTIPFVDLPAPELGDVLRACRAELVVNCVGVLQDGRRGQTADIHEAFVARLIEAIRIQPGAVLLVHVSIPGRDADDATAFSRTKRAGERRITASGLPFVILRPGFVVAPAAYGGSALMRALAALPITLPPTFGGRPFAATAMDDIGLTVGLVAQRWASKERHWAAVWDLCEPAPADVAAVVEAFRSRFGGPAPRLRVPGWLLWVGAWTGDMAAGLGWSPPVRTTALREMRRGVDGDPRAWMAATGITPATIGEALGRVPATVQERWFARLFLLKPAILVTLVVFWIVSGVIALTAAFPDASAILSAHGIPPRLADALTVISSLLDIGIGLAIALRSSCPAGLIAGIALSVLYMAGAAVLTPDLWLEPLGSLVKTGPAILLMATALAILDER